jgi:hypothetical protein
MAKKTKRGRKQDRALVAGRQDYEVRYLEDEELAQEGQAGRQDVGSSRKKVVRALGPNR